jgi:outer membrane lipoprotein carrier protein
VTEFAARVALPVLITTVFAQSAVTRSVAAEESPLDRFAANVHSLDARYDLQLIDSDGLIVDVETGRFQMQKSDGFRWYQESPFETLTVVDDDLVWYYKIDLEEAECAPASDLDSSPYRLLSGQGRVEDDFEIQALAPVNGLEQLRLVPFDQRSSGFVSAVLRFDQDVPVELEFLDGLEQTTHIRFSGIDVNPELADDVFEFVPPEGVHIVCDFSVD